jgi:PAS domain S-box-containing protein
MPSPKSQALSGRSWAMLPVLFLLGILGNFYALPLFFGADFLFGSIAVLLILYFYGLTWGFLAAIVVNSYTFFLWGHPYGFIMFVLEALCVGYLLRSGRRNLLLLDGLFWLLIGFPLNGIFYYGVLHMGAVTTGFIMLKQGINGIFNALLACLAINHLPLDRLLGRTPTRRIFSLQEGLFNVMAALVLAPALLLTVLEIRGEMGRTERRIEADLQTASQNIKAHLHFWYRQHLQAVTELAGFAAQSPLTPSPELQKSLELMKRTFPDLRTMYVANAAGITVGFYPPRNVKGEPTIGKNFSDRPYFRKLQETRQPVMSAVFRGRIAVFAPLVTLSVPIIKEQRFAGFALAGLNLSQLQKLLESYGKASGVTVTLTDTQGQIIASTSPERAPLTSWDGKKTGIIHPISRTMFRWSPPDKNLPSMTCWQRSFFVEQTAVGDDIPWVLTVEAPIAPHQQHLYSLYVQNLAVMAVLTGLILLLALALSRWLANPLNKLAQVTSDLPDKIMAHRKIDWPASSAAEMDSLIDNFQSMTQALERNFQALEEYGKELAKANAELQIEVSEREQAEQALRDSEAKYRSLIDNASEAILLADVDANLLDANRKAEELLGYSKAEILHLNIRQIHPEAELERTMSSFAAMVQQGEGALLNAWLLRRDGTQVPVDITGSTIEYAGKKMLQGIIKDISDRQKTEAERLRMSKLESLGTLAGGIAHDFNNILTAILGNISLAILDPNLVNRTRERLTMSEKACQRAHALAQQLLTFAKGGTTFKKIAALKPLLQEAATLNLAGSRVRCDISVPDDLWSVEVDVNQIDQVLSNLLINAEQAMPMGGTIRIRAQNVRIGAKDGLTLLPGQYVKLSLADEGVGIAPNYLDKIFDPYFSTKQKGSGLGLTAAYSIIQHNAGHIGVESAVGRGTTFIIHLPATEMAPVAPDREPARLCLGQGRILVMDDEEIVREVMGKMLAHLGYEVEFAADGAAAIARYSEAMATGRRFAAVILDLTIPGGMGGKETMEKLLTIDPQTIAIVSSGYSDDPIMADFQTYGFSAVIAKPYKVVELSKILQGIIPRVDASG